MRAVISHFWGSEETNYSLEKLVPLSEALALGLWYVSYKVMSPMVSTWEPHDEPGIQLDGKTGVEWAQHWRDGAWSSND